MTSLPPPLAPEDWYPDPTGRYEHRYWSGATWTEHVQSGGKRGIDPFQTALSPPNTPNDWIARELWRTWRAPANAIRGESKYPEAFGKIPGVEPRLLEDRYVPVDVEFLREPGNPYDRFACKALVADQLVGYLSRECAKEMAPVADMAGASSWVVAGVVVGGLKAAPNFGVHVWLDRRLTAGPAWS